MANLLLPGALPVQVSRPWVPMVAGGAPAGQASACHGGTQARGSGPMTARDIVFVAAGRAFHFSIKLVHVLTAYPHIENPHGKLPVQAWSPTKIRNRVFKIDPIF